MTDAEQKLWFHLRRKQIEDIQFYRQRPIGNYIVDFYAPTIKLVIEVDGSQHLEDSGMAFDADRTLYLNSTGLKIMRFDNLQLLNNTNGVLEMIHQIVVDQKSALSVLGAHLQEEMVS